MRFIGWVRHGEEDEWHFKAMSMADIVEEAREEVEDLCSEISRSGRERLNMVDLGEAQVGLNTMAKGTF